MKENELMLTELLQCRRVDLYTDEKPLTLAQQKKFDQMKARRANHEPLQYVVGVCEFMGLDFYVDRRVLVPRPETEILAEAVLKYAKAQDRPLNILDVGTGSGNIAVSLAKKIEDGRFMAIDVSCDAIEVATRNAKHHGVLDKIHFVQVDFLNSTQDFLAQRKNCYSKLTEKIMYNSCLRTLLAWVTPQAAICCDAEALRAENAAAFFGLKKEKKFDIIISNPPYIPTPMMDTLPLDVQQEPTLALDGGEDGLTFYRAIAQKARKFLKPKGKIFLEIGDGQEKAIEEIFKGTKYFVQIDCLKDYTRTPRILILELI
ncbi:MAG: HemK/PrmC family methyltransferase [Candidatus Aceula meridiana]|nr:HemK/PrmC family methyltransferase [Candidatus Aceula meridiana]